MARSFVVWNANKTMGFTRIGERLYRSDEVFGVTYELEWRRANIEDGCPDSGWYLYSKGADGGFFGEWCDHGIRSAVNYAVELIVEADLRPHEEEREHGPG